jgi:hypothetical protein
MEGSIRDSSRALGLNSTGALFKFQSGQFARHDRWGCLIVTHQCDTLEVQAQSVFRSCVSLQIGGKKEPTTT